MPKTLTELVTVEAVKTELRIAPDVDEHNAMITQHMQAALSLVEGYSRVPIIDTTETIAMPMPQADTCMVLPKIPNVLGIDSVEYFPTDELWLEGRSTPLTTFGRLEDMPASLITNLLLFPPANGWPEAVRYDVTFNVGLHPEKDAHAINLFRQAVIAAAKYFYSDQPQQVNIDEKLVRLIGPYARILA